MFESISKVVLITDMDGTFLPSDKIPSKGNLEAVKRFQSDGGKFAIATGRAIQAADQYFNKITVNCPIIMCNGGMVYDIVNNKHIYDVYLPSMARNIVKNIIDNNQFVGCEILRDDGVYVPKMTELEKIHNKICKVEPIECSVDDIPDNWYKVLFAVEPENMQTLIDYVKSQSWSNVDFVRSSKEYYEILPLNVTKGYGLEIMRNKCNMKDYTFVAVGDYNNDIEMLKTADVGVCPSNAADDVKEIADIVLDVSCDEDAIATVIDYIYKQFD